MKFLYANGDSWTHGDELSRPSDVEQPSTKYYNSWPWHLSQIMEIPVCVNDAQGGTSNARIFRRTNEFIFRWLAKNNNPEDLLIVIGWTTPERSEIGVDTGIFPIQIQGPLQFNSLKIDERSLNNYHKAFYEVYSDAYGEKITALYMMNLRLLCKSLKIKFYDFVAIGKGPQYWQDYIKTNWNYELTNMYMNGTWHSNTKENNWSVHEYDHPTKETHKLWAEIISKEIK